MLAEEELIMRKPVILILLVLVVFLASCTVSPTTPTSTPTQTVAPTATFTPTSTSTQTPTITPSPTLTPVPTVAPEQIAIAQSLGLTLEFSQTSQNWEMLYEQGQKVGEIVDGELVLDYDALEAASRAAAIAVFEAREDTADTLEAEKERLFSEMKFFSTFLKTGPPGGEQLDGLEILINGKAVGVVEKYFRDIDQIGKALLVLTPYAPNGELLLRVATKDENGKAVPITWIVDNIHDWEDTDKYNTYFIPQMIEAGLGPDDFISLDKVLDETIINTRVYAYIPFTNTTGNDFDDCAQVIYTPCAPTHVEAGLDITVFNQVILNPDGYYMVNSATKMLTAQNSLQEIIVGFNQAEMDGLVTSGTLTASQITMHKEGDSNYDFLK
jgi:hypothetical protein